jgi:ferrochelatase
LTSPAYFCPKAKAQVEAMRRGIVLMNLGSPDSTAVPAVRKYLNQFLMDGRVLDMAAWKRFLLVRLLITPRRAPKTAHAYRSVWTPQGAPLLAISRELQKALQAKIEFPAVLAMRYGRPSPREAFERLLRLEPGLDQVLLLPLYPHYAMSSYETALVCARKSHQSGGYRFGLQFLRPFYDDPGYLQALAEQVRPFLQSPYDHLLFSYHGIPERHLKKTDPTGQHCLSSPDCCQQASPAHARCYRHQCLQATQRVAEILGLPAEKFSYSFQSRLGRDPWLKPYTDFRLEEMPREGIRKLLVVCPSFVSDCLETLEEVALRGRASFLKAGGHGLTLVPCLNEGSRWVETLSGWIRGWAAGDASMLLS